MASGPLVSWLIVWLWGHDSGHRCGLGRRLGDSMDRKQEPETGRDQTVISRLLTRLRTPIGIAVVALLLGVAAGYVVGQERPSMHEAQVACLSAPGVISCGPVDSPGRAVYAVPRDVAWTANGTFHPGGRPACLPPTGRGTVEVRVTWTRVEVEGAAWKQVVGVHC